MQQQHKQQRPRNDECDDAKGTHTACPFKDQGGSFDHEAFIATSSSTLSTSTSSPGILSTPGTASRAGQDAGNTEKDNTSPHEDRTCCPPDHTDTSIHTHRPSDTTVPRLISSLDYVYSPLPPAQHQRRTASEPPFNPHPTRYRPVDAHSLSRATPPPLLSSPHQISF